jgi:hypothetical protein
MIISATFAFSLVHDQLAPTEGDLWVGDSAGTPFSAISFSTIDGAYNRWVANDYEAGGSTSIDGFAAHYGYFEDDHQPGDFNIEVYENDLNTSPIGTAYVAVGDLNETDTGWVTPTSGVVVWLGEMTFTSITGLTYGNTYWVAAQIDSATNAFNCCVELLYWDEMYWYGDDAYWIAGSVQWPGNTFETSVRFDGTAGIESASVGEIKAIFK